jgi:hypothetical protein
VHIEYDVSAHQLTLGRKKHKLPKHWNAIENGGEKE